jgi:hypothetical protein
MIQALPSKACTQSQTGLLSLLLPPEQQQQQLIRSPVVCQGYISWQLHFALSRSKSQRWD